MKTDILRMVEASQKGQERGFTYQPSEGTPPKVCNPDVCPIKSCPQFNNPDQVGEPCIYYVKPNPAPIMPTDCSISTNSTLDRIIEQAVSEAFAPLERRLQKIEEKTQSRTVQRSVNGEPLPAGYPELFKLRRKTHHDQTFQT